MNDASFYATELRSNLTASVIPFWVAYGVDPLHGGTFSCLDRDGTVYDTDKFVWLQARYIWTFAMLSERLDDPVHLRRACDAAEFLLRHGRDPEGAWYFALTRTGAPLVAPYNIFSDCFAAMAFSQLGRLTGDSSYADLAAQTFDQIEARRLNPKGPYEKRIAGSRQLRDLALPMILANLVGELAWQLPADRVAASSAALGSLLMEDFFDERLGVFREQRADDPQVDAFATRLINPGHSLETAWFLMDLATRDGDAALAQRAAAAVPRILDYGWDSEHGGLFYFRDAKGAPPDHLDWDRKLWWVHGEALVAVVKALQIAPSRELETWFRKLYDYTMTRFPDPKHGEWFGYLDREGRPFLSLKGGKWKGCFHVPRALQLCADGLDALAASSEA